MPWVQAYDPAGSVWLSTLAAALPTGLLLLTLGLYQPFASIALARLRLDALSISMNGSPDDIVAETGTTPGVAGDAGADVFGVDIGL